MSKQLKKKAWSLFSTYIRRKYADRDGMVSCITCGTRRHWKDRMDAGHYISRAKLSTFLDERNVHPQCKGCNSYGKGKHDIYALYLTRTYGAGVLEELNALKNKTIQIKDFEYLEIIDDLQDKLVAIDMRDLERL